MCEPLLKRRLCCCIDDARTKLRGLSRDIWSRPELAYREHAAHHRLLQFFREEGGWQLDAHFKLDTAFRARWAGGGGAEGREVNVGFLCEYDALPEMGHACGHNLIAEVGVAAAVGLRAVLEEAQQLPVRAKVTVLGTPAEEDGGGKIDMLRTGAFEGLDVVFMAHPSKEDAPYLPCVAEQDVTVRYHGEASPPLAHSWTGTNALDAAVLCYNSVSALRQQMKPDWRVHGIIKRGGEKAGLTPTLTELEYYLRTPSRTELPALKDKAERCFRSAAMATGCELAQVEVEFTRNQFDDILRNFALERLYEGYGAALGMEFTADQSVLKNESGSTDFGNVSYAVPGIHPYFYIGSNALNHTEEYAAAAGDDRAQFFTLRAAKALAMSALDLLLQPELLRAVRREFSEARTKEEPRESAEGVRTS